MVVALTTAPAGVARPECRACEAAPTATFARHVALPCRLEAGHTGYHETHVRVARDDGSIAGYTYSWLA